MITRGYISGYQGVYKWLPGATLVVTRGYMSGYQGVPEWLPGGT